MWRVAFSKGKGVIHEDFETEDAARRWEALVKKNGYKVLKVVDLITEKITLNKSQESRK